MIDAATSALALYLASVSATLPAVHARVASHRVAVVLAAASHATGLAERRDL